MLQMNLSETAPRSNIDVDVVKVLIQNGTVECCLVNPKTALHWQLKGHVDVAVLLQNGADVNAVDKQMDSTSLAL